MQSDDGHLVDDPVALSALADIDLSRHPAVLDSFPPAGNGKRANVRALKEWIKRKAISGARSEAGSKGMANRYQTANKRSNKPITSVTTSTSTSTMKQPEPHPEVGGDTHPTPLKGCMPVDGWDFDTVHVISGKPTVEMPPAMVQEYFDKRTATGWVDASKRPVARTRSQLESDMRSWKVGQPSHGKAGSGSGRQESPRELQTRIDAAMTQREAAIRANDNVRAKELTTRIQGWKRQIAGG
jgi:hypothetical protein